MTNDVRMPIETYRDGEKTTKICVEDVYKMINRIQDAMYKALNESQEILDSVEKTYWPGNTDDNTSYHGSLIIGKGVSEPCDGDKYDETTGNEIAFMKAKLNASHKKYNIVRRIYNKYIDLMYTLDDEFKRIMPYIDMDLEGIRKYNKDYWKGLYE